MWRWQIIKPEGKTWDRGLFPTAVFVLWSLRWHMGYKGMKHPYSVRSLPCLYFPSWLLTTGARVRVHTVHQCGDDKFRLKSPVDVWFPKVGVNVTHHSTFFLLKTMGRLWNVRCILFQNGAVGLNWNIGWCCFMSI